MGRNVTEMCTVKIDERQPMAQVRRFTSIEY